MDHAGVAASVLDLGNLIYMNTASFHVQHARIQDEHIWKSVSFPIPNRTSRLRVVEIGKICPRPHFHPHSNAIVVTTDPFLITNATFSHEENSYIRRTETLWTNAMHVKINQKLKSVLESVLSIPDWI
jgi:hypothetical protein